DKMLEAREQCPLLQHIVYDDPRGLRNYSEPGLMSFEALLERGGEFRKAHPGHVEKAMASIAADEPAAMFYTSGTTGKPKGVVLSHHSLIDRALVIQDLEGLTDEEDVLAYLPPA